MPPTIVVGQFEIPQATTLAAFRACLALRIGFEFDVRRTKDGALVCLHDATVDRTTDGHGNVLPPAEESTRFFDAITNSTFSKYSNTIAFSTEVRAIGS